MRYICLFILFIVLYNTVIAQTIPFSNIKINTRNFAIEKTSPTIDISKDYRYNSVIIPLQKGDALFVTAVSDNENAKIAFYCREKGNTVLLSQINESSNAWYYHKAASATNLEIVGVYPINAYIKDPQPCTVKYIQGNANDFYFPENGSIASKILALAYGKPLAFTNLYYSRNVLIPKRDTLFGNVFVPNDKVHILGSSLEYDVAKNVSKANALEMVVLWKKYIDTAFENTSLEDKQVYNEQDMKAEGFPEILFSLSYSNIEELSYVNSPTGIGVIFKIKLQAVENSDKNYDITLKIE